MVPSRTQRVRQRKHQHQMIVRLLMFFTVPPLLAGAVVWAIAQARVETSQRVEANVAVEASRSPRQSWSVKKSRAIDRESARPNEDRARTNPRETPRVRGVRESGLTVVDLSGVDSGSTATMPAVTATGFTAPQADETHQERLVSVYESALPLHGHNSVDDAVFAKLFKLGIEPAGLCSDEVFLRRVYIDVTGTLPRAHEAKAFLRDTDERKRRKLIDKLLEKEEYADYWAMKWCDILRVKAEFPINLWPNAAQAYHRWIRTAIRDNLPYDQFAKEMLTASGSNFRTPQVNFYRAMQSKEPEAIAKTVALTFMATRADKWPAEKLSGMSQFFTHVGFKPTGEWKEEIVYYDRRQSDNANAAVVGVFPNGRVEKIPGGVDPRFAFADWLIQEDNPWFARAYVNRVWFWLFGRGIVDPPDDVRADNPATNRELLSVLAKELVSSGYDMKQLLRLILNSSTYQLSCVDQAGDPHAAAYFALLCHGVMTRKF
ncbi:DUF1549 domain-containing protein [Rhodopirellula sallentina]|uniref:Membrane or secreted protein containing DUF1549 n=1 Tax=Rhodopirellula sallentina SM41 TaxID=1263870 RepID=M5U7H5_9BACT|nr:DUF1549 domain-containing protein [Rhodopirellula sallentina]EMI57209.1 membrane or secreted protein containing DUF1549 [Rhodopirellula sallentina SM41]